jgi:hypothetical protein
MNERLDEINWLMNLFNKWCVDLEIALVAHECKDGITRVVIEDQRDGKKYGLMKAN